MSFKFKYTGYVFLQTIVFLMSAAFFASGVYYWKNGYVGMESINAAYEGAFKLDELRTKDYPHEIDQLVNDDRIPNAIKLVESLDKTSRMLGRMDSFKFKKEYDDSIEEFRKAIVHLVSFSSISKIFSVLSSKVADFEEFANQNQWRTLTRMAARIQAKLSPASTKSPGSFNPEKLAALRRSLDQDIRVMSTVTESSVLSRTEKDAILIKLKAFEVELEMIDSYQTALRAYGQKFEKFNKAYRVWLENIGPAIAMKKLEIENSAKYLFYIVMGLSVFLFGIFFMGMWTHGKAKQKNRNALEDYFLKSIKNGIVSPDNRFEHKFSAEFSQEFDKLRDYVHKRMNFGSLFQVALPFSSLMLDSNLNLIWANKLFLEQWGMSSFKEEGPLSWDYLQRFTNLGENDPVLTALNENIAGIYQIQIKRSTDHEALPYEMYVAPVDQNETRRIMIFFYPLRSLEETVANQAKSIVGPVSRSLVAMTEGRFNDAFQTKIRNDFEVAGISDVFEKFRQHYEFITSRQNQLERELENCEDQLCDYYKLVTDLTASLDNIETTFQETFQAFANAKHSIVNQVELRFQMEEVCRGLVAFTSNLRGYNKELVASFKQAEAVVRDSVEGQKSLRGSKTKLREVMNQLDESRSRLARFIEQSFMFNSNQGSPNTDQFIHKLRMEVANVEKLLAQMGGGVKEIELVLSKSELLLANRDNLSVKHVEDDLAVIGEKIENQKYNQERLEGQGKELDELMISGLKDLYLQVKSAKGHKDRLSTLITTFQAQEREMAGADADGDSDAYAASETDAENEELLSLAEMSIEDRPLPDLEA